MSRPLIAPSGDVEAADGAQADESADESETEAEDGDKAVSSEAAEG